MTRRTTVRRITRLNLRQLVLVASVTICISASSLEAEQTLTLPPTSTHVHDRTLLDAPKYYHLNELLYKTTSGDESPQAAALPNLRPHLGPRGGDVASAAPDENDSPIDGLVREMRGGRKESTMTTSSIGGSTGSGLNSDGAENGRAAPANGGGVTTPMRGNNFGPDDEATIQRKSTNLDYNPAEEQPPARLRTSRGKYSQCAMLCDAPATATALSITIVRSACNS